MALANITTTAAMLRDQPTAQTEPAAPTEGTGDDGPMSRTRVGVIVAVFIALQATNTATVSIMSLFVTQTLGLPVTWAGVALGVAAGLEIPALLLVGRLNRRHPSLRLITVGCLTGIAYYAAMTWAHGPLLLLALQALNALFLLSSRALALRCSSRSFHVLDWPQASTPTRADSARSFPARSSASLL